MRPNLIQTLQKISPFDDLEFAHKQDTLEWIESGSPLYRIQKPDVPPKHLVAYFVLIDPDTRKIMLTDHIKAQRWLPTGGHVEVDEHPKDTVMREIQEELHIPAIFLSDDPLFISQAVTGGLTPGHTDVSIWYIVKGDEDQKLEYDTLEFNNYKWFTYDEALTMPEDTVALHLHRFIKKLKKNKQ